MHPRTRERTGIYRGYKLTRVGVWRVRRTPKVSGHRGVRFQNGSNYTCSGVLPLEVCLSRRWDRIYSILYSRGDPLSITQHPGPSTTSISQSRVLTKFRREDELEYSKVILEHHTFSSAVSIQTLVVDKVRDHDLC